VDPQTPPAVSATSILAAVRCPRCDASLDVSAAHIVCAACGQRYPRLGSIPVLFREPDTYLAIVGQQLRDLAAQIDTTWRALESQVRAPDVLPRTRARCEALLSAARQQHSDIAELLTPLLPPATPKPIPATVNVPSLLTNIHYLFRDWGWPPFDDDENARTLAAVRRVLGPGSTGTTLVLGAGACRLASDLHRAGGATETVALDIDALLVAAAGEIMRGGVARMTEGYADINEDERPSTRWTLRAHQPTGDAFHLMLADGLDPPFAPDTFDTVVTPWFIDAIPSDLRDAITVASTLLRRAGRWVSIGPLRYASDVPIARRFSREEVFELVERAGLRLSAWEASTWPSLVSPQTGRGRMEWVVAFCAVKDGDEPQRDAPNSPPAWILFGHLPIPTIDRVPLLAPGDPLSRLVLDAIDGFRTLDDVTVIVSGQVGGSGFSRRQLREAVRRCLADLHPAMRQ
jgi:hypothetical protein